MPGFRYTGPRNTAILTQYTILPSGWVMKRKIVPEAGAVANLSEADNRMLRSMARALVVTLRIMKRLGHVILVTNAETGRPPRHPGRGVGFFSGGG